MARATARDHRHRTASTAATDDLSDSPALAPARNSGKPIFDHDRLQVYQDALSFLAIADDIIESLPRGRAYLADQLHRAALSVVANIAKGAGEFAPRDKAVVAQLRIVLAPTRAWLLVHGHRTRHTREQISRIARQERSCALARCRSGAC